MECAPLVADSGFSASNTLISHLADMPAAADMQRTRCRAGQEVSQQRARARTALRFVATLAVLLMQMHGATASSNSTVVAAGSNHACAILVSMPHIPWIHGHRAMGVSLPPSR